MRPVLAACGGFLLAVLWFDLMFDVQVLAFPNGDLPEPILASIAGYYRRVTTEASPMSRLVAAAMITGLAAAVYDIFRGRGPRWRSVISLVLLAAPILLAAGRVFANAARLGARTDSIAVQSEIARGVCQDHIFCFAGIGLFVLLQVLPYGSSRSEA